MYLNTEYIDVFKYFWKYIDVFESWRTLHRPSSHASGILNWGLLLLEQKKIVTTEAIEYLTYLAYYYI